MNKDILEKIKKHSLEIKKKFKVKEIGIFGSHIKGKAKKRSDVDILVEFKKEGETFDNYMELKFFLEDIFNKKVDLVLKNVLKEGIRDYILSEVVYV
jgi:predicted nucleotidyltransferase